MKLKTLSFKIRIFLKKKKLSLEKSVVFVLIAPLHQYFETFSENLITLQDASPLIFIITIFIPYRS